MRCCDVPMGSFQSLSDVKACYQGMRWRGLSCRVLRSVDVAKSSVSGDCAAHIDRRLVCNRTLRLELKSDGP